MIIGMKQIAFFLLAFICGCGSRKAVKVPPTPRLRRTGQPIKIKVKQQIVQPKKIVSKNKKGVDVSSKKIVSEVKKIAQDSVKKLQPKEYKRIFALTIEGMTCPVCEKSALYHLRRIKGIKNVEVKGHNELCEEHKLVITWKSKENPPLGAVVDAIEKEDFILHQFTGKLRGRFVDQDRKKQFIVQGTGEPFTLTRALGNSRSIHPQVWERVQKDKLLWVNLTIWRDLKDGVYKAALNAFR